MKNFVLPLLLLPALFAANAPPRPKILGVAHMALYVANLEKSLAFYHDFLGYDVSMTLPKKDGSGTRIAFVKINDNQYLELFNEAPREIQALNHISFYTDNATQMRDYLAAKGVKVPATIGKGQTGSKNYNITDPDNHIVEIVEYQPTGMVAGQRGKFMPATRISTQIMHLGVLVGDLEASQKFYNDILGFTEFWRGSSSPRMLSWVNERVPDGKDYLELMLYNKLPEPDARGGKNHVCLMVPDIERAVATLESRPARKNYEKKLEIATGVNKKRQVNIFDPDGTRIEIMEPDTIDGSTPPNSTAPVPHPEKTNP